MTDEIERVRLATRDWLERLVIGLGLCPFAAEPHRHGRIGYVVCGETADDAVYRAFVETVEALLAASPQQQETTLLILSRALAEFDDYLQMLDVLEHALDEAGLAGVLQLASFHPAYRFEGVPADDPANYSNRSPYPMFHLIRERELAAALDRYPDPEKIPLRNVERLRALGVEGIEALLAGR
jgi:hypothetical protein